MLMGADIVNDPGPGKMLLHKFCAKDVLFYGVVDVPGGMLYRARWIKAI
jgi:hypothetical protein